MADTKKINEEIEVNKNFNLLTTAFQEHALGQINFARFSVLYARGYSEDLIDILVNVKTSYLIGLLDKKKKKFLKKNNRSLWILVTANNKLYGDIINKTVEFFISKLNTADLPNTDFAIIGKQGKRLIDASRSGIKYSYYEIKDTNISLDMLKELTNKLNQYETVYVFFARFENLITQLPVQVAISGTIPDIKKADKDTIKKQHYLFEPNLKEIILYFENQILSLVFNQVLQEAQLARFASRITAMESAQLNIKKQLDMLKKLDIKLRKAKDSKKQGELLAGRNLWMAN